MNFEPNLVSIVVVALSVYALVVSVFTLDRCRQTVIAVACLGVAALGGYAMWGAISGMPVMDIGICSAIAALGLVTLTWNTPRDRVHQQRLQRA